MTKEIYNDFYKKHGLKTNRNNMRFFEIAKLCKGRVLDIGCGTGDLADFYAGEYAGIDVSNVAIEMAEKSKRKTAIFAFLDATKTITEPLQRYDTIVMAEFLEHIDNETILFENIKKWATPNARLIISVPNGDRVPDKNHLREFTVPELRKRFSPLGKVKFHCWSGFESRIIMSVDLGEQNHNPISLAMIIKNEETGLEDAILSCIEFVDEIVIAIDNKSEDKSEEIAKRYADDLKYFDWKDDFAAARNFAQEGIKTKWILVIDGHEYIEKFDDIEEFLKEDVDGLMVRVNMEATDAFYTNRIFRSYLTWKHAIHNTVSMKTTKKYNGLTIKHNLTKGQSKNARHIRSEQRDEMMPRLLEKEMKENKKDLRAVFYLARWFFIKRQPEKALKLYNRYLKYGKIKGEMWYCCWEASVCANSLSEHLLALKFLRKANELVPNRWEISKQLGLTYMSFEYWDKAVECLVDSLKENKGDFSHYPEKKNLAETWDQIGFCFYQLKRYNEARVAWERSIETDEDCVRIKLNKKRIELIERNIII